MTLSAKNPTTFYNVSLVDSTGATSSPAQAGEAADAADEIVEGIAGETPKTLADINTTLGSPAQAGEVATSVISIDLNKEAQKLIRAHTAADTAEEVAGGTAFDAGATVLVVGKDTYVQVGSSKAAAEAGPYMPAGVPFKLKLATGATTFWIDAATGGTYSVVQVS